MLAISYCALVKTIHMNSNILIAWPPPYHSGHDLKVTYFLRTVFIFWVLRWYFKAHYTSNSYFSDLL